MVFTSPYMYYDAELGPMVGFVYAGTTLLTLAYAWFCVGETVGRTNAEIERFFVEGVPVRKWATHVFESGISGGVRGDEGSSVYEDEKEKGGNVSAAQVEEKA